MPMTCLKAHAIHASAFPIMAFTPQRHNMIILLKQTPINKAEVSRG